MTFYEDIIRVTKQVYLPRPQRGKITVNGDEEKCDATLTDTLGSTIPPGTAEDDFQGLLTL